MAKIGEPGNLVPEIFWTGNRQNRNFFSQHFDIIVVNSLFLEFEKSKLVIIKISLFSGLEATCFVIC